MAKIVRDPASAAKETYDLVIIGGGIYGVMLSLAASRRNLRSLLIERNDFGGATSFNSLRIIHGGLRYLQTGDLHRFCESVRERHWFLQRFPELVKPLPCLMPLHGEGLRRPSILRPVLHLNDFLSFRRNDSVREDRHLPPGRVVDVHQTREIFPSVDLRGLKGGAVWYDAFMLDSQRLLMEILRWSCKYAGKALNYVEAQRLLTTKRSVAGVVAMDRESGRSHDYKARIVINAAGPWSRDLAASFHRDEPALFKSSIAWNVLLDREALSKYAVAVSPKKPGAPTYFLVPWKGRLLAGTGHAPWCGSPEKPMPSQKQLQEFLEDLNLAVPGLELDHNDIYHVFAGLLPVTREGSVDLASRPVILNHKERGGPEGFYSVSGVKFTTSRSVAEKTLGRIFPEKKVGINGGKEDFNRTEDGAERRGILYPSWGHLQKNAMRQEELRQLVQEEAVQHLDDLVFRRTNVWENASTTLEIVPFLCRFFNWSDSRGLKEFERLTSKLGGKNSIHNHNKQ